MLSALGYEYFEPEMWDEKFPGRKCDVCKEGRPFNAEQIGTGYHLMCTECSVKRDLVRRSIGGRRKNDRVEIRRMCMYPGCGRSGRKTFPGEVKAPGTGVNLRLCLEHELGGMMTAEQKHFWCPEGGGEGEQDGVVCVEEGCRGRARFGLLWGRRERCRAHAKKSDTLDPERCYFRGCKEICPASHLALKDGTKMIARLCDAHRLKEDLGTMTPFVSGEDQTEREKEKRVAAEEKKFWMACLQESARHIFLLSQGLSAE